MSNVLYLEGNAKFLVNRHSAVVDDFGKISKDWDNLTLQTWLELSKYAAKHLGYHCQLAHNPEDVVMLCDMAVELGWMVSITAVIRSGSRVKPLPKNYSTQIYAVKSISKDIHKLYMRVDLGHPILKCLADESSGVLIAGSTVEYPSWLQQLKTLTVALGETCPETAFMAMASYLEMYRSWESGRSPEEHIDAVVSSFSEVSDAAQPDLNLVKIISEIHTEWSDGYTYGYATFLSGVGLAAGVAGLTGEADEGDYMRGWDAAKKVHELPFRVAANRQVPQVALKKISCKP